MRVDGVLLLDKPLGLSSNAALQSARRLFGAAKAGHAGTLDPLASGLLPVSFGDATKFSQLLLGADKRYRATFRFGAATSTGDAEGEVTEHAAVDFDRRALEAVLARFVGTIDQVPPRHAALKYAGQPYYRYARKGVEIPRLPRAVAIHALALVDWSPPDAIVDIACGKGTYVRVLAEDLALALGSRAHLAALRRTASGSFEVADAITLNALQGLDPEARRTRLLPVDAGLGTLPALSVDAPTAAALGHGRQPPSQAASGRYRGYGPEGFLGLIEATGTELRPVRMRSPAASPARTD